MWRGSDLVRTDVRFHALECSLISRGRRSVISTLLHSRNYWRVTTITRVLTATRLISSIISQVLCMECHLVRTYILSHRLREIPDQAPVHQDLLRHDHPGQDNQGQQGEVLRHVGWGGGHHGAPHWLLYHQWDRDSLLRCQNHPQLEINAHFF